MKPMVIRWACSAPLGEQVMLLEPRFFRETVDFIVYI